MKTVIAAFIMLLFSGCTTEFLYNAETIEHESRESISQFAQPGKTSNIAILKKFKRPTEKLVRDDSKYEYKYINWNKKINNYHFSTDTADAQFKQKTVKFVFNSDGRLEKFEYNDSFPPKTQVNVYTINTLASEKIVYEYSKLKYGESLDEVLKKLDAATVHTTQGDKQNISYTSFPLLGGICLEFQDKKLSSKYYYTTGELNAEEKSILKNAP